MTKQYEKKIDKYKKDNIGSRIKNPKEKLNYLQNLSHELKLLESNIVSNFKRLLGHTRIAQTDLSLYIKSELDHMVGINYWVLTIDPENDDQFSDFYHVRLGQVPKKYNEDHSIKKIEKLLHDKEITKELIEEFGKIYNKEYNSPNGLDSPRDFNFVIEWLTAHIGKKVYFLTW